MGSTDISGSTTIAELLAARPGAAAVLSRHGLGCAACMAAEADTVAEAADMHSVPLDMLLEQLQEASAPTTGEGQDD
ncbi:MAG: DUF1858 domain-containing protein [Coriobacteriia bacterium]